MRYSSGLAQDVAEPPHKEIVEPVNLAHRPENSHKNCFGCGSAFHSDDPMAFGYNPTLPAMTKANIKSIKIARDNRVQEIVDKLGEDKKAYLNSIEGSRNALTSTNSALIKKEEKLKKRAKLVKMFCELCRTSLNTKETWLRPPAATKKEILDKIPPGSTIVHVFDALDFPVSADLSLLDWAEKNMCKVIWVLNKCDLFVPDKERTQGAVVKFARRELLRLSNGRIRPEDIYCVNSHWDWFLENVYEALGKDNYIVGYANVGKSTFALHLASIYRTKSSMPRSHQPWGRGSWFNPFITQHRTTFELVGNKSLTDMPSFPEFDDTNSNLEKAIAEFGSGSKAFTEYPPKVLGTYGLLRPQGMRSLTAGSRLFRSPGRYNANHVTTKRPHNVVSIGGLVALRQNTEAKMLVWGVIPDSDYRVRALSNLEKINSINASMEKVHYRWSVVRPELAATELKVIDKFRVGNEGASIVIRGVGLAHVQFHGRVPDEGIEVEVLGYPNVKVQRRGNFLWHVVPLSKLHMSKEKFDDLLRLEESRLKTEQSNNA